MKFRIGSSLLLLSVATVVAGDSPLSAKDALGPRAYLPSAKEAFTPSAKSAKSAKDALDPRAYLPSAKEAFTPSPKSAKDAKDILLPPLSRSRWVLGAGLSLRDIGAIDFKTGVTNLTIPMLYQAGNTPVPGIGAPTGLTPRIYNDGFVRPDTRSPTIVAPRISGIKTPPPRSPETRSPTMPPAENAAMSCAPPARRPPDGVMIATGNPPPISN